MYKCSKISNIFYILFSYKMLIFRAGICKMLVRIANREDLVSDCFWRSRMIWVLAVCLGLFSRQLVFKILEHLPYVYLHGWFLWPVIRIVSQVVGYGRRFSKTSVFWSPVFHGIYAGISWHPDENGEYQQKHQDQEESNHGWNMKKTEF